MKARSAVMVTTVLLTATVSLVTAAQDLLWGPPYGSYGYGMFAPPMLPRPHMMPMYPATRPFVPGPAQYPSRHAVSPTPLPLSQLGRNLERSGYEGIYKAELKNDVWEFLAKRGGELQVLTLDPHTGRLLSREPLRPAPEMAFATVVNRMEKQGFTTITEVEFENGVWEIEAGKDGETQEFLVEFVSGRLEIRAAD